MGQKPGLGGGLFLSEGHKVLVATGFSPHARKSEILDLATGQPHRCPALQQFPFRLYSASGAMIDGTPMICGGRGEINVGKLVVSIVGKEGVSNKCHILNDQGQWIEDQAATLKSARSLSGSTRIGNKLV